MGRLAYSGASGLLGCGCALGTCGGLLGGCGLGTRSFCAEVFGDVDLLVVVFLAVEDLDVVDFDVDVFLVVEVPFLVAEAEVEVSASVSSGSVT